jgi:hypothetical protein
MCNCAYANIMRTTNAYISFLVMRLWNATLPKCLGPIEDVGLILGFVQ